MSQISQKSISGITSITTPAGVDNQFTIHTNNTSEALKLDHAGNIHIHNHVNTTGISSASNFKTGSSNLHSSGLSAASIDVGNNIKLGNAGVITATSFVGDGSDLTNLPAGLGTALSATATSPLNKMYYTNQVLGVPSSITVDVPTSASKAYTQYADIKVESSADLIIAEGDDLIPDVLGLADFGTFGGGATAGRIRVNSISNAANDGSPTVQKGLVVTGVCTATTFSGSGASLTNLPSAQLTGALPALDGSNLTGISGVSVANQSDNRLITATGTTDALNGEANLTYDGTTFKVGPAGTGGALAVRGSANSTQASFSDNASGTLRIATASGALNLLLVESGQSVVFGIGNNSGLSSEYLRITSSGHISQGGGAEPSSSNGGVAKKFGIKSNANNVIIGETESSGNGSGLHIESRQTGRSGGARIAQIGMKNDASGNGQISFFTSPSGADVVERMVINSSGTVTAVGIVTATVCLGAEGTAFKYDTITQISNIDITNSYATTSTYYKWVLPSAGLYMLQSSMRVRMWGTTGYIQTRLYDNTASSALSNSERMMWEQQGLSGQYTNVNITLSWVINVASGRTIYQQFRTSNQTTGNGIQRDGNGHNYMFWQKLS